MRTPKLSFLATGRGIAQRGSQLLLAVLTLGACWPTEADITSSLDEELRSVSGRWVGSSTGTNPITLDFTLSEAADGQVAGSGTMKEQVAMADIAITVSGTFRRPDLSLTFDGMNYEGEAVRGSLQTRYVSVGGVADSLQLSGDGGSRKLWVLLQER